MYLLVGTDTVWSTYYENIFYVQATQPILKNLPILTFFSKCYSLKNNDQNNEKVYLKDLLFKIRFHNNLK